MKNQMILKILMFSFSIFALLGGGFLFVLSPELALGYKVLALCCGVSILGISFGIFTLIETISTMFQKMDAETAIIKENLSISKESVEILEALNVIEIKKNKTIKDIYELISTGKISNKETENVLAKADNPVKVEINSEKLELLLEDIKTLLSSGTVEQKIFSEKNKEDLVEKEIEFEEKEEVDEENIVSEPFEEEVVNTIEENSFEEQTNESFNDEVVEEEKIEPESVEIKEEILNSDFEENKNKVVYDLEANIEEEETEQSFTKSVDDGITPINTTTEIMSAGDYFNESQENKNKTQETIEETNFSNFTEKNEEMKQEMVYGLVAEEQPAQYSENKKAVHFVDAVIEDLIRDLLEKPSEDILESDLQGIDVLLAGNQGVKRLEGLEKLVNLQKLDLWKAEISDIEILKGLKKLVYLRLSKTMVKDITPLKEIENLEELYLQEVPIQTLKPISSLQRLKYLYLEKTKIDSLEPLLEISTLEELYLWGAIIDLTPGGINSEVLKTLESRGCSIIK